MKYLIGCVVLLLLLTVFLLGGSHRFVSAMDGRGDKQFSFTDSGAGVYGGLQPKAARNVPPEEPLAVPSNRPPEPERMEQSQATNASSQTGQSGGNTKDNHIKSKLGGDYGPNQPLQDNVTALKQGQSAGQVSNVPGTTSTAVNGMANGYGTGGLPQFLPEGQPSANPESSSHGIGKEYAVP